MQEDSLESDEHPSLATATLKGVFWMTATRGLKAPLSLIAVAILARILTPADFGIIALGMVVASFSDMLVDGSFSLVLIQRREIDSRIIGGTFALSAGLATFFAAGVILSAPYIERDFNFTHLRDVLIFFATILPITAITTVTTALLQRRLQFRVLTVNAFCSQLAYSVSSVALAVAGMGVWSLVWAQMLQSSIDAALGFLAVRKRYRIKLSVSGIREVLGSGGVFTASKILKWAANSVDRVIIGRMLGAAELGFYTRSTTLMGTARQLAGAGPTRVLFSSFAKMQNDSERLRRAYTRALSLSLVASALVSGFMIVNSELIVRILLGPKWLSAVPLMEILFLGFLPKSGAVVAEAIPLALGLARASAMREGAQLILVMIGAAVGAQFGISGAAAGVCAAYWLFYLACLLLVHQLLQPDVGQILRLHANSLTIVVLPLGGSIAVRWLLPGTNLLIELVSAAVFGLLTILVLAIGPGTLVGHDIVRARSHLLALAQTHAPRFGSGT